MPEQEGQAPTDLEALLALYREARGQVAEAEIELQHGEAELGTALAALTEELDRLRRALRERQTTLIRALNDRFRQSFLGGRVLARIIHEPSGCMERQRCGGDNSRGRRALSGVQRRSVPPRE